VSSGYRAAPGPVVFFGGMTKVNMIAEGDRLSSPEVGSNVVHLFSNVVDQEQGNTTINYYRPLSFEALSPQGYNFHQTKVNKDIPSSFYM
jgi:hypothetical protein